MDRQPDEEVPSAGASVPVEVGQTQERSERCTLGVLETSSRRWDQSPMGRQLLPPSQRTVSRAERSKLLIITWSSW